MNTKILYQPYLLQSKERLFLYDVFYFHKLMPCCGKDIKFFNGPRGGECTNIKCFHCGEKWNICPPFFIQKI